MQTIIDVSNEIEGIALIGQSFDHDMQPYGRRLFIIEQVYRSYYTDCYGKRCSSLRLCGRIYWGRETSRLFQYSSTKDIAGQWETVYGVQPRHLEKMEKVSVAM